jgi:DNA-binding transcriptional MerR regulator
LEYSALQAARLTGCSEAQLSYWGRIGLVAPDPIGYGFRDLVALRVVSSLLEAGLTLTRVRQAVRYLVESGDDIAGLRLVTDGTRVWACRDDGQILDALRRGQMALFVAVDAYAQEVDAEVQTFDAERRQFVDRLRASSES